MRRCALALMMIVFLAGCAGHSTVGGASDLQVIDAKELPPPTGADLISMDRPYLVGPFDTLSIDVFGIAELQQKEIHVDASGRISFPLAGIVEVAGKTPGQIEQLLRDRLAARYVRNPQVTVNLKETVSQVVTVDGEVKKPGLYPVVGRMTLLRAIAKAEGTGEFSKLNEVVVFRTVQGQKLAALYNIRAIRHGAYDDPEVYANDVVVVGDSRARRIFRDFLTVIPVLTGALIVAVR